MMNWRRGFTLVELLVVVSIIALLLSIMVPSLRSVKDKAKIISCRLNLRSMHLGAIMYSQENDSKLFSYDTGLYIDKMALYTDSIDEVRYCASTRVVAEPSHGYVYNWGNYGSADLAWCWKYLAEPEYGSYSFNGWFYSSHGNSDPRYYGSVDAVSFPKRTPCFIDAMWVDSWPDASDEPDPNLDLSLGAGASSYGQMNRLLTNRHGDKTNVAMIDGRVESMKLCCLWRLRWNKTFEPRGKRELPKIPGQ